MPSYRLATPASRDFVEIIEYLSENAGIRVALRVEAQLRSAFRLVAMFPALGHTRQEVTSLEVLFITEGDYVIVYRRELMVIVIIAILHGSRDIESALQARQP